ncbi:plasmid replication initiator TrfA [Jonquetella anthropi]|uniref:plasmid replication initiator TrfA n=1 Tax=Jonquetella anthropi TaxID=428712 RepID=UPI0001B91427|nr:plasmid replication initiator TrfA [Jonquetella anthropi]EEX47621.1 hypothetical protein GCWU000246_01759 [Jonquetella anthropi E3_33 E1]
MTDDSKNRDFVKTEPEESADEVANFFDELERLIEKYRVKTPKIAGLYEDVVKQVKDGCEQDKGSVKRLVAIVKEPQLGKITLPKIAEGHCATPIQILRTSLFGLVRPGRRKVLQKTCYKKNGCEVSYIGIELDQKDLDIWMGFMHFYREQADHNGCVSVSIYEFLKQLGLSNSGSNHKILKESLKRLTSGAAA